MFRSVKGVIMVFRFLQSLAIICLSAAMITAQTTSGSQQKTLLGFDREGSDRQRAIEKQFDSLLKKENLREWMKRLSARPHHLGSPYGKDNADFIAGLFRSWGYETEIERFDVLFPTPKTRVLEMTSPEKFTAKLEEPVLKEDTTSGQKSEQLPVYNAYSVNGDVTGQLVYVNYGVPQDYEELERRGVDVKDKIVIARYGGSWRGIKPKVAAEHGALGCIIYSDPRDDGFYGGDVYPKGAWRNESGAQRGSVADMPLYPGDPLTPGIGATANAKRLEVKDALTLTKIPVLPISYGDALPLLRAMEGPVAPAAWRGALPITYHIGPGRTTVHLKLEFDFNIVPAYDVIARLRGSERPDEWVIRGNHHDAWVNGAGDPISGLVPMLEEARAISELTKTGWRPRRSIVYAVWDGEEPGLIGSTEWAETHAEELQSKAVLYLNSDGNSRGFLNVGGSHTLEKFINDVARDVIDPEKEIPVFERSRARAIINGDAEQRREVRDRADLRINALGSGSDYTPFLQHLGIATLNIGYGGEGENAGIYHSIYDSFDHYIRFSDPTFDYGIALAKTAARAVLRFADADYLPLAFSNFSDTITRYVNEVIKLANDERDTIAEKNRRINEKTFEAVDDPAKSLVPPKSEPAAPYLNFAPLQNALARLQESTRNYGNAMGEVASGTRLQSRDVQQSLDNALRQVELAMITERGLPRRPWFKHQIYAPGFYTGYGVKTLPGIREAIEQHKWDEASEQIVVVATTIEQTAAQIDRVTTILKADR
jgi:N-acetylated-alpha-linked acidic dipeptidase